MRPVLSTRIFGAALPSRSQLELAYREYFLDLELWTDPLMSRPVLDDERWARQLLASGMSVPCLHLPTRTERGPVDLSASSGAARNMAASLWRRCLDLANVFGSRVVVAHVQAPASSELMRFAEEASARHVSLALETNVGPGSSLGELLRVVRDLPALTEEHGLCIDLSREPLEVDELNALGRLVKWVEISGRNHGEIHLPPDESSHDLQPVFESLAWMPFVAFEVVTATSPGYAPGDAELSMLLRRIRAWMRDYGRIRHKEGIPPNLPMG